MRERSKHGGWSGHTEGDVATHVSFLSWAAINTHQTLAIKRWSFGNITQGLIFIICLNDNTSQEAKVRSALFTSPADNLVKLQNVWSSLARKCKGPAELLIEQSLIPRHIWEKAKAARTPARAGPARKIQWKMNHWWRGRSFPLPQPSRLPWSLVFKASQLWQHGPTSVAATRAVLFWSQTQRTDLSNISQPSCSEQSAAFRYRSHPPIAKHCLCAEQHLSNTNKYHLCCIFQKAGLMKFAIIPCCLPSIDFNRGH